MKGESGISVIEANTKKSRAMQMNQVFDAGLLFDGKWMNDGADELAECKQTLSPLCVCVSVFRMSTMFHTVQFIQSALS